MGIIFNPDEPEHKCDPEDCLRYCEMCSKYLCIYTSEEYKRIDDIKLCIACYNKEYGYDSEGRYL